MSNIIFNLQERNLNENQKALRKIGEIPGIIYGEFLDKPIPVKMKDLELRKMLKSNNSGSIIPFSLNGKKFNCVVKEVQKSNFNEILHIDLQYTKPNEVIKMKIPVMFTGQENLIVKRLILDAGTTSIEFQGCVEKIPEYIEINVSDMNINDKIFVKDITVPEDVIILDNPDILLAVINPLK